ncbi:MAG: hypothetical protein ABIP75_10310, partial [Pyrinomonadaceae bacterium]
MRQLFVLFLTAALFLSMIVAPGSAQEPKVKGKKPAVTRPGDGDKDRNEAEEEEDDPDLPPGLQNIDKGAYLRAREEQISFLRGLPYPRLDV